MLPLMTPSDIFCSLLGDRRFARAVVRKEGPLDAGHDAARRSPPAR